MGALRDPKLETFAQALYSNLIAGMRRSEAADLAADAAGYKGTSRGSNARKRAQRKDVLARMNELQAPAAARAAAQIEANKEWARRKLTAIAEPDLGEEKISVADQIRAVNLLSELEGWKAAEQVESTLTVIVKGGLPETQPSSP